MQLALLLKKKSPLKISFHSIYNLTEKAKQKLDLWRQNYISRRELAQLSPEQLIDIGKTIKQAKREAAKPFWHE